MGSSSKSSSTSTSSEVADSYNQISTPTVTASGANSLGLNTGAISGGNLKLNSNSGNDSNNVTGSNNYTASYGASSPISDSASGSPTSTGFDWGEVLVWVVGGVALMLVLRYFFNDKNA